MKIKLSKDNIDFMRVVSDVYMTECSCEKCQRDFTKKIPSVSTYYINNQKFIEQAHIEGVFELEVSDYWIRKKDKKKSNGRRKATI